VTLEISTPALLFPAVSLLFLSYTNRFLHLAALVRTLHGEWEKERLESARVQIDNLRRRLFLIRWMQLLGAISLLLCVISMLAILSEHQSLANGTFFAAVVMMSLSLASLIIEIVISGGALRILLGRMEE
jgi:small-conductance mechanosensitive channel